MKKYVCEVCGFVYDPEKGIPEMGIPPGTPFEDLPPDFECPVCSAGKRSFSAEPEAEGPLTCTATLREVVSRTPTVKSFRWTMGNLPVFKPEQHVALTWKANRICGAFFRSRSSYRARIFGGDQTNHHQLFVRAGPGTAGISS